MRSLIEKYLSPLREGEGAAGGGAAGAAAAASGAAKPWHEGVEAEILGHWQNKGWKIDDPKEIALAATKQAREAERHFGVPTDRLLKLPATDARPEDVAAFWQRLGAPKEATEYDFAGVKHANGNEVDTGFVDKMRGALLGARVPKDQAASIVKAVIDHMDGADAAATTIATAKIAEEKAALAKNWGPKFDHNYLQAREGAKRAGVSEDAVKALEGQVGYASVMELFRRIGASSAESVFHEGSGDSTVNTRSGAIARLAELENDKAFGKRLTSGDAAAAAEWRSLTALATGEAA